MRHFATHLRNAFSLAIIVLMMSPHVRAAEKYWVAHEAQLILVGTLHPNLSLPWFDGWHVSGMIAVDEVLYGQRPTNEIKFRFLCSCCRHWPPPRSASEYTQKGLWFLRSSDSKTWEPANGCSDSGFRNLSERANFEKYIHTYKHLSSSSPSEGKRSNENVAPDVNVDLEHDRKRQAERGTLHARF